MAKAATTKKLQSVQHQSALPNEPDVSDILPDGDGAAGEKTRLVVVYGSPGGGKTYSVSSMPPGTRWIITDQNTVATLDALGRLPAPKFVYSSVKDVAACKELVYKITDAIQQKGLSIPGVVLDSLTALNDWHQQDVARNHGQQWLGQNQKDSHWQDFNTSMGALIDALADLAKLTNVIVVCHAAQSNDSKKGQWQGLSLTPKMAERMARVSNWILLTSSESRVLSDGDSTEPDDISEVVELKGGLKMRITRLLHTKPVGNWAVKCASKHLDAEEPNDVAALLRKEGLLS